MRYDFFDLELILNIATTGSLTQAAVRSCISLQAASERIKKLEQQFETQLLIRQHKGVMLTLAGHTLKQQAQQLLQQQQELEREMHPFRKHSLEHVVLWCNSSAQSEYLPKLLPQYLCDHPQFKIELHEAESSEIVKALRHGTARLALVSSFVNTQALQTHCFADDPLVLVCPNFHPLATATELSLDEVLHYDFIGLKTHHSLQQVIDQQATLLGRQIQYRLRLPNFTAIVEVVAKGIGVAILPARAVQKLHVEFDFKSIPLSEHWANRQLLVAALDFQKLSKTEQIFAEFLISTSCET
ncbi:LysR family transcriptional regulator [Acinetobacter sp. MD2]|uniref:LysR family transcriptional regulator n=1 Tax=Acinetobacter sp. MD2 TaxID=2600066 RepID=UPI002D1F0064|nr:LysR family transcriptional regulator [Acinetobacter sp. MD2]MEB3768291.1 LysR family transcriptional regulator [Acinetobacter sp. MD2]